MRKNDTTDLAPNFSKTNGLKKKKKKKKSLFNRIVNEWNGLPIMLENQKVLQLLKGMFSVLLRIIITFFFIFVHTFFHSAFCIYQAP